MESSGSDRELRDAVAAAREEVAATARGLAAQGLVLGTAGNLSARVTDELVAVSPTGARLAELEAEEVALVDLEGEMIEGRLKPTSELGLHLGIYRRHGAGAVIHTHAVNATAVSTLIDELPLIHYGMLLLGGSVRVAPYRTFGSPELAAATLDALEGRTAALMANHGAITFGVDLPAALAATELLEWACEVYLKAAAAGSPRALSRDDQQNVVEAAVARDYGAKQAA